MKVCDTAIRYVVHVIRYSVTIELPRRTTIDSHGNRLTSSSTNEQLQCVHWVVICDGVHVVRHAHRYNHSVKPFKDILRWDNTVQW